MTVPGSALGATVTPDGLHVATLSSVATAVELCLFDGDEEERLPMRPDGDGGWHVLAPGRGAGTTYGLRVHGPYDPAAGHRCNPAKLLVDPWARQVTGRLRWHDALVGGDDTTPDARDSAPLVPRAVAVDPTHDWDGDQPLDLGAPPDHVVYEAHVRGLTMRHPDVPEELRGTYLGVAHPAVVDHLQSLGVTAVELLPIAVAVTERRLAAQGMVNHWGYNPLVHGAPDPRYATAPGREVDEVRAMVAALHRAGIAVLLDVVLNHTAEGDHTGPTLNLRGLDNDAFYRLDADDRRFHWDVTGCGNAVDLVRPASVRLAMDALRRWVDEYHVDGFRYDLGLTLARGRSGRFDPEAPLLTAIRQDPVLASRWHVVEPWDLGPGGYRLGGFPAGFREWNDAFRDTARAFWRGDPDTRAGLAMRLAGSEDPFGERGPTASTNLVTAHDGFTLRDLVSYERKHNAANREGNRDGHDHNLSTNHGVEGPTHDPDVLAARSRHQRNLLTTLLLAQGIPMLTAGDELGRTQHGNNNAYCHDSELTWVDWDDVDADLLAFTSALTALRRELPSLRRTTLLAGPERSDPADVAWFDLDAQSKAPEDWAEPGAWLQFRLDGRASGRRDADGQPLRCPDLLVVVNGEDDPLDVRLAPSREGRWRLRIDTARLRPPDDESEHLDGGTTLTMPGHSIRLLTGAR